MFVRVCVCAQIKGNYLFEIVRVCLAHCLSVDRVLLSLSLSLSLLSLYLNSALAVAFALPFALNYYIDNNYI